MGKNHLEHHYIGRSAWLRAAVLGANDGIISVSSLVVGVASAASSQPEIALAGIAGLVAGAMSMAAGEYVSVCSQSDLEGADLAKEQYELEKHPEHELQELVSILKTRGLDEKTATAAAKQMTAFDALGTHAREEMGISDLTAAKPLQAAMASGIAFSFGAIVPVLSVFFIPENYFVIASSILCLVLLGILGGLAAITGGSKPFKPAFRVMFWGALAMGLSAIIGNLVGAQI